MQMLAIGQDLGSYRIEALLGAGGMGVVYLARDQKLQRRVAIKIGDGARAGSGSARSLLQEARTAAALNHPAICGIHEVGHVGGEPFIVMEHVEGNALSAMVPPGGLSLETTLHYAIQIVDAVAHAHRHAIAHGDLKSANVMIEPDGRVKLLDFGLAVRWNASDAHADVQTTRLRDLSSCVGTVPYMAPELLQGARPCARSDIWAIGVMLYEMLAGFRPYRGATVYAIAAAILAHDAPPLPHRIQAPVRATVARALARRPDRRFASATELAGALDDL
ncbi:MAG TPA: serine/threonine-protein kinase [Vicinamibacterales bacterium]|jgi:serine/threonine-protein kinase